MHLHITLSGRFAVADNASCGAIAVGSHNLWLDPADHQALLDVSCSLAESVTSSYSNSKAVASDSRPRLKLA
ncbi:hypothetical protein [Arthrobacter sp. NA-172]|uniref:hypothetical protein n=1 Tax=Arthrobacter sp. NA-172 TaxID=3367524 RepID=UPI003754EAD8